MNERIRELAEQANYLATEKEFPYDTDWFYLYNKKFAELIVQDCIKQCQNIGTVVESMYGDKAYQFKSVAASCELMIKQRFGIEE